MSSNGNLMLSARGLTVGWPGKSIAAGVDLDVAGASIQVIAGPNGAGKSTLLKTLARQLRPLAGQLELNQKDAWSLPPGEFARMLAYVPQSLELAQDLTVRELVMLGRSPHQRWWSWKTSPEDSDAVEEALEKTETRQVSNQYLSNLSGGEKQRAMIAMALAQKPVFMLLDEPTAHLDFRHQIDVADLLGELKSSGLGIVMVLHDLNLIDRLADSVLLLSKQENGPSCVASTGPPSSVLQPDNLRRVYDVEVSIVNDPDSGRRLFAPARR